MGSATSESVKPGAAFRVRLGERAPSIQVKPVLAFILSITLANPSARRHAADTHRIHTRHMQTNALLPRYLSVYRYIHTLQCTHPRARRRFSQLNTRSTLRRCGAARPDLYALIVARLWRKTSARARRGWFFSRFCVCERGASARERRYSRCCVCAGCVRPLARVNELKGEMAVLPVLSLAVYFRQRHSNLKPQQ